MNKRSVAMEAAKLDLLMTVQWLTANREFGLLCLCPSRDLTVLTTFD